MKRPKILIITAFAVSFLVYACYYDKEELLYPQLPGSSGCDTLNVTYAKTIRPILQTNCYGCHSNANASAFGGGVALENYSDVAALISHVYGSINWEPGHPPMPNNGTKLNDCLIREVYIWMQAGTPNN